MSFCNAPVMCHSFDAFDPALPFPECLDDVYLFPESSCTYPADDNFWDECSQGFASHSGTSSVSSQHPMVFGPQLGYGGCEEPWFPAWIDNGAGTQEPQTCRPPMPGMVPDNALSQVDTPASPILALEDSTMCLSGGDSSDGSPLWPRDDWGDCEYPGLAAALPLEPEQSTKPDTEPASTPPKKSNKKKKKTKKTKGLVHCPVCNIKFEKSCHLRAHMHDHDDLFKCEDCEQTFPLANNLATHRKSHEWTPQPCPICRKVFANKSSYRAHVKRHDENRQRVKCPHSGCNKDFSQQAVLNRHLKIHDPKYPKPTCDGCSRVFNRADVRDRHRVKGCRGARPQRMAQKPSPPQLAPQQPHPAKRRILAQARLPTAQQQHPRGDFQPVAPPWAGPTTQLAQQPLQSQTELYYLDPGPLDARMAMAMQDHPMPFEFMNGLFFEQGFGEQVDMVMGMGLGMGMEL